MKNIISIALLVVVLSVFSSCKKDTTTPNDSTTIQNGITVKLNYQVDGLPLAFDTVKYTNQSGNLYGVSTLYYYISGICLQATDGSKFTSNQVQFVNAQKPATNSFSVSEIPDGNYEALSFYIGVDSAHNIQQGLPNTPENLAMEWPEPMGGGYHFLRLEGYYRDSCCTPGYAMHLGTNACLVKINLPVNFSISSSVKTFQLTMDIGEWFKNPHVYDFNLDGNYSMGNVAAMLKLSKNGVDVFKLN